MRGSSQKLVFLLIASLQKVIQWTTNEVTQTLNYETVAKVEGKMKKVLKRGYLGNKLSLSMNLY